MENTKNTNDNRIENTGASDGSIKVKKDRPKQTVNDRPQNKNLKPFNPNFVNTLTTEEAQKRGRNGGIKSAETKRARKTMKQSILAMMEQEISPDKLQAMGVDLETLNGDYTLQNAVIASLFRQAIDGDTKAAQLLRDTIDEAPTSRQEIRQEVITADDLSTMDNLRKYLTG